MSAEEVQKLTEELAGIKSYNAEATPLKDASSGAAPLNLKLRQRRKLEYLGKVADVVWSPDNKRVAVATNDGNLIVHNAMINSKDYFISLNSWFMATDFSPSGKQLAVAGLENVCTIHDIPAVDDQDHDGGKSDKPVKTLKKHTGYIGALKWLSDKELITGSGDQTCVVWDAETGKDVLTLLNHAGDVSAVDAMPGTDTFLTGSTDSTVKLWDRRAGLAVLTLAQKKIVEKPAKEGEEGKDSKDDNKPWPGVNCVRFMPSGNQFLTGCEDGIVRLFDTRANSQLNYFDSETNGCNAVECSLSGRVVFAGHESGAIVTYDTLTGAEMDVQFAAKDSDAITALHRSKDGKALAVGSRDKNCYIYA